MEEEQEQSMNNLRGRRKKSGISCYFGNNAPSQHNRRASFDGNYSSTGTSTIRRSPSSSTGWFKSKAENSTAGSCKISRNNFMSRMGAGHRRYASADQFSYDPLSYALNFDEDAPSSADDYPPALRFTARLPVSPPARTVATLDHHKLPRAVVPVPRSPPEADERWKKEEKLAAAGSEDLRRGFEALSVRIKSSKKEPAAEIKTINNKPELSSPRAAAIADVRRTLEAEEVTSPGTGGISSNRRGLLVQLC